MILSFLVSTAALAASATTAQRPVVGDEDPFPLRCVDFSGKWRADSGAHYVIGQHHCDRIQIAMTHGSEQASLTIVPDNQVRTIPGLGGGMIRQRWNNFNRGTVLELHLNYQKGGAKISEVITYEMATPNLLLETTYRTIDCPANGKPRQETEQEVFRRAYN